MEELKPEKKDITLYHKIKATSSLIEQRVKALFPDKNGAYNEQLQEDLEFFYGIAITNINKFKSSFFDHWRALCPCVDSMTYEGPGASDPFELAQNSLEYKSRLEEYKRALFKEVYWTQGTIGGEECIGAYSLSKHFPEYDEELIKDAFAEG